MQQCLGLEMCDKSVRLPDEKTIKRERQVHSERIFPPPLIQPQLHNLAHTQAVSVAGLSGVCIQLLETEQHGSESKGSAIVQTRFKFQCCRVLSR